jgi:intracellular septation protein A
MNLIKIWWALLWRNIVIVFFAGAIVALFQDQLPQTSELPRFKRFLMDVICTAMYVSALISNQHSPIKSIFGKRLAWSDKAWIRTSRYFTVYYCTLAILNGAAWMFFGPELYRTMILIHMPLQMLFPVVVALKIISLVDQHE